MSIIRAISSSRRLKAIAWGVLQLTMMFCLIGAILVSMLPNRHSAMLSASWSIMDILRRVVLLSDGASFLYVPPGVSKCSSFGDWLSPCDPATENAVEPNPNNPYYKFSFVRIRNCGAVNRLLEDIMRDPRNVEELIDKKSARYESDQSPNFPLRGFDASNKAYSTKERAFISTKNTIDRAKSITVDCDRAEIVFYSCPTAKPCR